MAITRSSRSGAPTNTVAWRLPSSPAEQACATSRCACARDRIRAGISRNTLANANQVRDWRVYANFAQHLIREARSLYAGTGHGLDLDDTVYALDSSTIDLCLSLFPWASFRKTKGAVKLHTLLDLRGNIPAFVHDLFGEVPEALTW